MAILDADSIITKLGTIPGDRDINEIVELNIDLVEDALTTWLGRPLEIAARTQTLSLPAGARNIFLEHTPVTAVTTVEVLDLLGVNPVEIDQSAWTRERWGVRLRSGLSYPGEVTVAYSAGLDLTDHRYAGAKTVLYRACVRECTRDLEGLGAVKILGVNGAGSFNLLEPEAVFTAAELRGIQHLRRL